ncbi:hypothetical protein [Methanolacinia petrolearia]|uniref:hypothetical protein n=1 Tax=Methanolacinia petrolearia TaxID=54120 RepID=UPI003BA8F33F
MEPGFSLVVISDKAIAEIIKKGLKQLKKGSDLRIDTKFFGSAEKAFSAIETGDYDLIIARYKTADLSGTELIREIKEKNFITPLIIIADPADDKEILKALHAGLEFGLVSSADLELAIRQINRNIIAAMDLKDVHERSGYSKRIVRVILDSADNLGIITTDENKIITFFSGGAEKNTWLQPRRTGRQRNSNEIPHRGRNLQPCKGVFGKDR